MQHCEKRMDETILAILRLLHVIESCDIFTVYVSIAAIHNLTSKFILSKTGYLHFFNKYAGIFGTKFLAALMPHYWMNRPPTLSTGCL